MNYKQPTEVRNRRVNHNHRKAVAILHCRTAQLTTMDGNLVQCNAVM